MNLLQKEEQLKILWQHVEDVQISTEFVAGIIIIISMISLFIFNDYNIKTKKKIGEKLSDILVIFFSIISILSLFFVYYGSRDDNTTLSPSDVVAQNISIIRKQNKLPKLIKKKKKDSAEYLKLTKKSRNNLEVQSKRNDYKKKYINTKQEISNIRSLTSFNDKKHQARTKYGGFHNVRKPETIDYFLPNHYDFKK